MALALLTAGCAAPQKDARVLSLKDANTDVIIYPTELRGAYVVHSDNVVRYCAEPAPDVALDTLQKLNASLGASQPAAVGIQGAMNSEISSTVVQLAGRTQLLLLAREMLYRACELTLNNPSPDNEKQAIAMYQIVANLVNDLGNADKSNAEANLLKAQAEIYKYTCDNNCKCIQSWLNQSDENYKTLIQWLKKNTSDLSIPQFLNSSETSGKRKAFISLQQIQCH